MRRPRLSIGIVVAFSTLLVFSCVAYSSTVNDLETTIEVSPSKNSISKGTVITMKIVTTNIGTSSIAPRYGL